MSDPGRLSGPAAGTSVITLPLARPGPASTVASRNEGETFQSLTINGKNLVTYVIAEEDDPDPAKTRSRYEAACF
jgi:hypothetical protein